MDGSVAHLHCRYRVLGDPAAAPEQIARLTTRLDDAVRPRLADEIERALDLALGDDPSVYLVRRVRSSVALSVDSHIPDNDLGAAWAERLAGSIVRTLAHDPADGANLVRFDSQADYVASFVADLLEGQAWERWYYLAFRDLKPKTRDEAVVAVLLDNRELLPEILYRLERRGALETLLDSLSPTRLSELWHIGLAGRQLPDQAGLRPLFAAALEIVQRLSKTQISGDRSRSLFRAYRESGAAGADDWSQVDGLAKAVAEAVGFLLDQVVGDHHHFGQNLGALGNAVSDFDWLDRDRLTEHLRNLADENPVERRSDSAVTPPRSGSTPEQRRLLADLMRAIDRLGTRLDVQTPDSPANALRLRAALEGVDEAWSNRRSPQGLIETLLRSWAVLGMTSRPRAIIDHLRAGELAPALAALASSTGKRSEIGDRNVIERLARLGPQAGDVLDRLIDRRSSSDGRNEDDRTARSAADDSTGDHESLLHGLETPAGGAFLLLRAINDLRLPSLFERSAYPPEGVPSRGAAGVLALALRVIGDRWAAPNGPIDDALARLAGLSQSPDRQRLIDVFSRASTNDHDRFQTLLLKTAIGQRLDGGGKTSVLRLFSIERDESEVLVAQLGAGDLWPLGRVVDETTSRRELIAGWLDALTTCLSIDLSIDPEVSAQPETGLELSADASLVDALDEHPGWPAWSLIADDHDDAAEETAGETSESIQDHPHRLARERLIAAMDALDTGRLGRFDGGVAEADSDLTIFLTASVVLRAWSRWLRQFADSSVPFLLENFLRRDGRIVETADALTVEVDGRPLDLVLEMAGYFGTIESPWGRTIDFSRRPRRGLTGDVRPSS